MIPATILGSGAATGGRRVSTAAIAADIGMDPAEAVARTGIEHRFFLDEGEDVASIATEALRRALEAADMRPDALSRVILVHSAGGDVIIPATANRVLGALGISRTCDAFDVNNACTGFLTGLDLAARSVATGMGPVGVVAAEGLSRLIGPDNPRSYLVMGDAAAAVIVGPGQDGAGIEHGVLRNAADFYRGIIADLPTPDVPSRVDFRESNKLIARTAIGGLRDAVQQTLAKAGRTLDEMDWVVPHQPNGRMVMGIVDAMGIPPEKWVPVVREIGSVGAASAPYSLDRLLRSGQVKPGQRILLCAVGAGMSYGAMIYRVPG